MFAVLSSLVLRGATTGVGSWIDSVIPPLHAGVNSALPGAPSWNKVAETFQDMHSSWGINAYSLPFMPQQSYVNVTMSDGVPLYTIVVNPFPYTKRKGTCLVRSPYGTKASQNLALIYLVLNGFAAVMQEDRGTWTSGGVYDMWREGAQDGKETMAWIEKQPWSNGEVYSIGGSADGIAGTVEMITHPSQLRGEWLIWTTGNGHHFVYPGGAFRMDLMVGYMDGLAGVTHGASKDLVIPDVEHNEAFGPWWDNLTVCGNLSEPAVSPGCRYTNVKWPVVQSVGWWDIFQRTQLDSWEGIRTYSDLAVRDQHVLFVGPLGHCIGGTSGTANVETALLQAEEAWGLVVAAEVAHEFFAGNVNGKARQRIGRVNLFVMGPFDGLILTGNFWTSFEDWPTPTPRHLYLNAGGLLTADPAPIAGSVSFSYDPAHPAPMLGGNNLPGSSGVVACGSADQLSRDNRSDVLVFDSAPLSEDLPVVGTVRASLFVSSSAKDTDFVITVSDLSRGKRKAMLVRYQMQRMRWRDSPTIQNAPLVAGQVYQIDLNLDSTAYIFPKGHSVRVTVSSSAAPYYNPTSNTGVNDMVKKSTAVVAKNTVFCAAEHPSHVTLPIVSMDQIPKNDNFKPIFPFVGSGIKEVLI
jgi:hypothetical protein